MSTYRKKPEENIPSARRKIIADRDMGYTFNSAVADIVDNCISHGNAKNIDIILEYPADGIEAFYIIDDGIGFSEDQENNVMKYGSEETTHDENLGKYGVGLKSASTSICKKLSVISKHKDDEKAHKAVWDLEHVEKVDKWEVLFPELDEDELHIINEHFTNGTGTIIKWEKIDRLVKTYQLKSYEFRAVQKKLLGLKHFLEMTFQRFLDREIYKDVKNINMTLYCNGLNLNEKLEPWDPFCRWSPDTEKTYKDGKYIEFSLNDKSKIVKDKIFIEPYLVPAKVENSTENQEKGMLGNIEMSGIYVYRNNRLIQHGNWLGMGQNEPHSVQARVKFDFNEVLDDALQIDIKKTRILLYQELSDAVRKLIAPTRAEARNYKKKKNLEKKKNLHDGSNKIIENKKDIITNNVKAVPKGENEVEVTNNIGSVILKRPTLDSNNMHIITGDTKGGALWEPAFDNEEIVCRINPEHPFYQKIYMGSDSDGGSFVEGLDTLLYSFVVSEHEVIEESKIRMFEKIRYSVSDKLEELVSNIPDPILENE